jgi:hypothetical protein
MNARTGYDNGITPCVKYAGLGPTAAMSSVSHRVPAGSSRREFRVRTGSCERGMRQVSRERSWRGLSRAFRFLGEVLSQ